MRTRSHILTLGLVSDADNRDDKWLSEAFLLWRKAF